MENLFEKLTNPKNRYEQVEAVAFAVLDSPEYFDALSNLPSRCKAAALKLFDDKDVRSYHADVIRTALRQYSSNPGIIDSSFKPYTTLELSL